jgi:hypothetical protein
VSFGEVDLVGEEVRGGEEGKEGNRELMERDEKAKIGFAKGKWGNRGLSKLVLGQNGEES